MLLLVFSVAAARRRALPRHATLTNSSGSSDRLRLLGSVPPCVVSLSSRLPQLGSVPACPPWAAARHGTDAPPRPAIHNPAAASGYADTVVLDGVVVFAPGLPLRQHLRAAEGRGERRRGAASAAAAEAPVTLSVSMPVHNTAWALELSINTLLDNTHSRAEIAFVLDACSDDSEAVLWRLLLRRAQRRHAEVSAYLNDAAPTSYLYRGDGGFQRALVYRATRNTFEVAADNHVFRRLNPTFGYVSVQADTYLATPGWDLMLGTPLANDDNVIGVSARCGMPFAECRGNNAFNWVGDCDNMVSINCTKYDAQLARRSGRRPGRDAKPGCVRPPTAVPTSVRFVRVDAIVRAPTMWRASFMREAGFFDELHFFQAGDEPDLSRRARFEFNRSVGVVALPALSNLRRVVKHRHHFSFTGAQHNTSIKCSTEVGTGMAKGQGASKVDSCAVVLDKERAWRWMARRDSTPLTAAQRVTVSNASCQRPCSLPGGASRRILVTLRYRTEAIKAKWAAETTGHNLSSAPRWCLDGYSAEPDADGASIISALNGANDQPVTHDVLRQLE